MGCGEKVVVVDMQVGVVIGDGVVIRWVHYVHLSTINPTPSPFSSPSKSKSSLSTQPV